MRGPTTLVALDVVGRSVVELLMVVRTAEDSEEESKSQYLRWKHFVVARALGRDFRLLHIHLTLGGHVAITGELVTASELSRIWGIETQCGEKVVGRELEGISEISFLGL